MKLLLSEEDDHDEYYCCWFCSVSAILDVLVIITYLQDLLTYSLRADSYSRREVDEE